MNMGMFKKRKQEEPETPDLTPVTDMKASEKDVQQEVQPEKEGITRREAYGIFQDDCLTMLQSINGHLAILNENIEKLIKLVQTQ